MCNSTNRKTKPCWNEMEELKYLIGAIDCLKCPHVPPPPSCSVMLPPRIQEVPCIIPPRRPPCRPPPPCCPPISPGPCCPCPLPRPIIKKKQPRPSTPAKCCPPRHPLPCYPSTCARFLLPNGGSYGLWVLTVEGEICKINYDHGMAVLLYN